MALHAAAQDADAPHEVRFIWPAHDREQEQQQPASGGGCIMRSLVVSMQAQL